MQLKKTLKTDYVSVKGSGKSNKSGKTDKSTLLLHAYGVTSDACASDHIYHVAALHTHKRGEFIKEDLKKIFTHAYEEKQDIRRLQRIACYRGVRMKARKPVQGQRSSSNARSIKRMAR